jgi:hypothetical protein
MVSLTSNGIFMKKLLALVVPLLGAASAFAQTNNDITVSTDAARAAAVERHAQELQARPAEKAAVTHSSSTKTHKHEQQPHHLKPHSKEP